VVYVDNDPIVLAHARALLVSGDGGETAYIHADLNEPERILTDPALTRTLDLDQPVGLMMVAIRFNLRPTERNNRRFERWAFFDVDRTRLHALQPLLGARPAEQRRRR